MESLLKTGKIKEALTQFKSLPEKDQEDFFRKMTPHLFPPPLIGVLYRKLHPGRTFEDFHQAWLPPLKEGQDLAHYFPAPVYVLSGQNKADPSDVITIGFCWVEEKNVDSFLEKTALTEKIRHDTIATVADKIGETEIYIVKDVTKLGS